MVVRGYITGVTSTSAWFNYEKGVRNFCGNELPEGLKKNQKFDEPILTPSTKAEQGEHDESVSKEDILARGVISEEDFDYMADVSMKLFKRGVEVAAKQGIILVDTKYEFGKKDGQILLIDEIHTPDSSRYFYADGYAERQAKGEQQKQLSKEFVRQWLISNGFQGKEGQEMPVMPDAFVEEVSERYIELYENITGEKFVKADTSSIEERILKNINDFITK
jgi:phosphoribosylaminoimidazole-succinocarboxamide synthase